MVKWISGFKRFFEDNEGNFSMSRLKTFLVLLAVIFCIQYAIVYHFHKITWIHLSLFIIMFAYSFGEKIFAQIIEYFRAKLGK